MSVQVPATQTDSEKVVTTVYTFLNEGSAGSLIGYIYHEVVSQSAKVLIGKMKSEKVEEVDSTFLTDCSSEAAQRWFPDYGRRPVVDG